MSIDNLLPRLDKVKRTGAGTWRACCPSHQSRGLTLSVRELDDGRILLRCFAECTVEEILNSVGMTFDDLFPACEIQQGKPERRPFPVADVLRAIGFEALVVAAAGVSLLAGNPFSPADRDRMILAVSRMQTALSAAGIKP